MMGKDIYMWKNKIGPLHYIPQLNQISFKM